METIETILQNYQGKEILLLMHHNADPDAVCSAIVLSQTLKDYKIRMAAVDSVSRLAQNILNHFNLKVEINPDLNVDLIVLLDTSTKGQLSDFADDFSKSKAKKIMIDHHFPQEKALEVDYKLIDEKSTSTVKLVCNLLKNMDVKLSKETALAAIVGIIAETAHLRYATVEDLKILVSLLESNNIKFEEALNILTFEQDISERIARLKASSRLQIYRISDYLIVTSNIKSFEASAARSLIRAGADLSAVVAKRDDEIRISLRSRSTFVEETGVDLAKDLIPGIVKIIDGSGSGHPTAAGANGKNLNKGKDALDYIITFLTKKLVSK